MTLEKRFKTQLEGWNKYCNTLRVQISSNPNKVTKCPQFKKLVQMGPEIIPSIRVAYNDRSLDRTIVLHGFPQLIREIVEGKFVIPEEYAGKMDKIEEYTIGWLDKYVFSL